MNDFFHIAVLVLIYMLLALSLNLLLGYGGLLSLGHCAFYGIGAYVSALSMVQMGLSFVPSLVLAVAVSASLGFLVAWPSLRLRGDFFVLATIGFQIIAVSVFYNWTDVTGGSNGVRGIPRPEILGIEFNSLGSFFALALGVFAACTLVLWRLAESAFGRALKAIREDELAAAALGLDVFRLKVKAFVASAAFAAVAGALFASHMQYIDPSSFTLLDSILVLSLIIVGGSGNTAGPILGTLIMTSIPEFIRIFGSAHPAGPNVKQIVYGILIIAIVRLRPRGLAGEYRLR